MTYDSKWKLNYNAEEIKQRIRAEVFAAVKETFDIDIKAEAQRLSPVSPDWPSIPESRGEKRIDTGQNRRSIDTRTEQIGVGVEATLFTDSGHGGYLEVGTKHMPPRPYLFPAFNKFKAKLTEIIGQRIRAMRPTEK